jgi:hypothetical protein
MKCLTPVLIRVPEKLDPDGYAFHELPCGKCPPCLKKRSAGWIFRLQKEYERASTGVFLTATYQAENISFSQNGLPTLQYEDHQNFVKRLRITAKRKFNVDNIKYYAVGEYGSNFARPHWHYILFNCPREILETIYSRDMQRSVSPWMEELWQKGHCDMGSVTVRSMAYVTGYVQKSIGNSRERQSKNDDRSPERAFMSKGLGENYLTPEIVGYYKKQKIPYLLVEDGKRITMPRYYKEKIYSQSEKYLVQEKVRKYLEESDPVFRDDYNQYLFTIQEFRKKEKQALLKRNNYG